MKIIVYCAAALAVLFFAGRELYRNFIVYDMNIRKIKNELVSLEKKNIKLKQEISLLEKEDSYLEQLARKELGVISKDEVEYRFKD